MRCLVAGRRHRTRTSSMAVCSTRPTTDSDPRKVVAMTKQSENASVPIGPGFKGSDEAHGQNWLHRQLPGSRVLAGVSWNEPILAEWARSEERRVGEE